MKQIKETPKEKSIALAVIQDDEGFDWSEFLPKDDAVGFAFDGWSIGQPLMVLKDKFIPHLIM
ncbi:hypothetical protein Hanom_Chr17g01573641 [Helianthus anomalus]